MGAFVAVGSYDAVPIQAAGGQNHTVVLYSVAPWWPWAAIPTGSAMCSGKNIPRKARALLTGGTQAELRSYLEASKPADDASCIVLDFMAALKNSPASRDIL